MIKLLIAIRTVRKLKNEIIVINIFTGSALSQEEYDLYQKYHQAFELIKEHKKLTRFLYKLKII